MSTKIGIVAEGPVDHALLPPLLERIARDRAGYTWPVRPDDVAEIFNIRKRGDGGVLETLRRLVEALESAPFDHAFFVILLDRRTRAVQDKIQPLLENRDRFVLGIAIEEIEAWWLADRKNTLAWADMNETNLPSHVRYAHRGYRAEHDPKPKSTLDELTRCSNRFDRFYGEGNVDLASEFGEDYWRRHAALDAIRTDCHTGYRPFEKSLTQQFRRAKLQSSRVSGAAKRRTREQ